MQNSLLHQLDEYSAKYAKIINEKDLEQVTAVREFGIKYLVSYDKHFEAIEKYIIRKQFVKLLGLQTRAVGY